MNQPCLSPWSWLPDWWISVWKFRCLTGRVEQWHSLIKFLIIMMTECQMIIHIDLPTHSSTQKSTICVMSVLCISVSVTLLCHCQHLHWRHMCPWYVLCAKGWKLLSSTGIRWLDFQNVFSEALWSNLKRYWDGQDEENSLKTSAAVRHTAIPSSKIPQYSEHNTRDILVLWHYSYSHPE
jgi:hypothetical protein